MLAIGLVTSAFSDETLAEGVNGESSVNSTEFYEQVEHSGNIDSIAQMNEFKNGHEKESVNKTLWEGSNLFLDFTSDHKITSYETNIPEFPKQGSGIFKMNSSITCIESVENGQDLEESSLLIGLSQKYSLSENENGVIFPTGKIMTINFSEIPGADYNV